MNRTINLLLGWLFFATGFVGIFLPLLPTVVFWILAAWFFARSAPHWRDRIYAHAQFGPPVRDFLQCGVLSIKGKAFAVGGIAFGLSLSYLIWSPPPVAGWTLLIVMPPVVIWLISRPGKLPASDPQTIAQATLILDSYKHWTGEDLLPRSGDAATDALALFEHPAVVASHGTETNPVLNFGNRAALHLWDMSWKRFTRTPSRETAEPDAREDRAALLQSVARDGFSRNYSGIRISAHGNRFRIHNATVWNLIDADGVLHGQAATFADWEAL
ncbi:MAG: MEKHLA domain-containing protein [Gammaproteobacteria bacterium]|nr:MEKHLA domain-containing protein [Gammaproteobacteria bacterium]MCP5135653.1 MEKHLA domain-containing protein [Gammaproteobacteria bacterium]